MNGVELGLTRFRAALHGPKIAPLAQYLNLWSLCDGVLVGVNMDFSTAYELEPEDVFLMDPSRTDLFGVQTRAFLNSLPPDVTLQFVVQIRSGDPEAVAAYRRNVLGPQTDGLSRLITDKKCEFIQGKFTQRRRYYLVATSHPMDRKTPMTWLLPFFRRPLKETAALFHKRRLREHETLDQLVTERLHSIGIRFRKLTPQQMLDIAFFQLNSNRPHRLEQKALSPLRTLREQVAFTPLKEEFDYVQVNDTYFRGMSLFRLPEQAHLGYTQKLLNSLWPDCDLVLTVHSLDAEKAISSLKLKNNISRTLAFSTWTKNYEAEQKHAELDDLITEIRGSAQRLFKFSLCVLARAASLDELRDKTNPILNAFHDFASAEAIPDDMNHFRLFLQPIPGHGELNDRQFFVQTNALAGFLPLTGSWRGSKDKKMLLETPLGELVGLDPFDGDLPAKHGLILGTTGSGKSFTTNYLLNNFMVESGDNHVVIIDIGGSYRKIAEIFGGEYLEVTLSEKFGFNPFPAKSDIFAVGQFDDDAVAYLLLLISRMCVSPGQVVTTYEKGFLERAIKEAYAKKEEVILADIREELRAMAAEHPKAKGYADALELWTTGMYGRLFNRKGSLDVRKRMVVFDLQNLENHPDLQGVYFFVIRSIIWGKLLNRELKKIIVIDEGWKFFNDDVGAELIENLYRTARKFNGAVFSISQSPKDFLDTKAANAIITNSYIKYVLKLTKGHELLAQFELNANEIEAIKQLQSKPGVFSDIFVKYGTHSIIARIEPCRLDYWICTTDAKDYVKESRLRAENPGLSQAELLLKLAEAK
ncbi:MAG: ATP-binding protein [Elusimicrobia bacterium]|nr:ATP-binding protein [Elusimicrobiota bacterium]